MGSPLVENYVFLHRKGRRNTVNKRSYTAQGTQPQRSGGFTPLILGRLRRRIPFPLFLGACGADISPFRPDTLIFVPLRLILRRPPPTPRGVWVDPYIRT